MIWGEIINSIRCLHFDFLNEFELPVAIFMKEIELHPDSFPWPQSEQNLDEWEGIRFPSSIAKGLELHPVERLLLEGPLLPMEHVNLRAEAQFTTLFFAVFELEKEWLLKSGLSDDDKITFFEHNLKNQKLKVQQKAGIGRLKVVHS